MDLGAKNGTTLNGVRIDRHRLLSGDLIEAADRRFLFVDQPVA